MELFIINNKTKLELPMYPLDSSTENPHFRNTALRPFSVQKAADQDLAKVFDQKNSNETTENPGRHRQAQSTKRAWWDGLCTPQTASESRTNPTPQHSHVHIARTEECRHRDMEAGTHSASVWISMKKMNWIDSEQLQLLAWLDQIKPWSNDSWI